MKRYWPFLLILLLCSCKKDEDSTLPSIRFTVPSGDFNSYSFGDLIPVRIEVSDDTELAKLVLVIQGTTNDQILASFSKSLSGIEQTISRSFPFDDVHIGSDTFLIKATVEDQAGNTKTAFREIQIFEAPLELLTIGTVSQSGSSVRIDTLGNGNFNFASQFQGDVSACAMGSYFQELLIGEASNATIQVIEPENWQVSSSYSAGGSISIDHFRDIYFDRSALRYYCSTFDGKIVVLKRDAFLASTIDLPQGYEAQQVITANGFIICSALQTGTSNYVLISFNQQTGIFQSSINLGLVPIELVSFDNDILVCSSSAIEVFNPSSGDLTNFNWLASSEPITAVVEGFADYYAVAHADGIYFYKFGENLLVFPNNQLVAKELHFNPINNLVYALTETELALVNGSNASVVSNFPVSSETEHLFLRFNK